MPSDRPLRVLQLVTRDQMGGVRVMNAAIRRGLREQGIEVEEHGLHDGTGISGVVIGFWRMARAILSGQYDAIFTLQAAANVLGMPLAALRGVKLRAAILTAMPEGIRPHWRLIDRLLGSVGVYTDIVSISPATTAAFAGYPRPYRDRIRLVTLAVEDIGRPATARSWRTRLKVPDGTPLLVATGRLAGQKNHATAIRALAELPDAHLAIAGDGPLQPSLEKLALDLGVADRLHLVGPLARDDIAGFLSSGDVYLFPSIWETFGIAGVEAAMAGLPIVAADLPILREVLAPAGAAARFHPVTDHLALAAEVRGVLAGPPDFSTRSAMRESFLTAYSEPAMIEGYVALIASRIPGRLPDRSRKFESAR